MMIRLFLILSIACIIGCGAENPVCIDDVCYVSESFPKSELAEGVAYTNIERHNILGMLAGLNPETPIIDSHLLHANILDTHGDEYISSITVRGEDMREYEIDLTLKYDTEYLSLSDRVIIKLTNPLQKGVYKYSGYVVDNLTSGRTWIN